MRVCTICHKEKSEGEFTPQRSKIKNTGLCKECKKIHDREYYARNKTNMNAASRASYQINKEARKQYAREYYNNHKDDQEFKLRQKQIRRKSYVKNIDSKREYQKKFWNTIKIETIRSVGTAECSRCGYSDIRALQIDHINGGGRVHRNSFTSNKLYMKYIRENPHEFQILCANCNWIKKDELNENRKSEI